MVLVYKEVRELMFSKHRVHKLLFWCGHQIHMDMKGLQFCDRRDNNSKNWQEIQITAARVASTCSFGDLNWYFLYWCFTFIHFTVHKARPWRTSIRWPDLLTREGLFCAGKWNEVWASVRHVEWPSAWEVSGCGILRALLGETIITAVQD